MNKIEALNGKFTSLRDEVIATIKSISREHSFTFKMTKYNLEDDDEVKYFVENGEISEFVSEREDDYVSIEYKDLCLDDLVFIMENCAEILEEKLNEQEGDLFEYPEIIPENISLIIESADENEDPYKECERMQRLMKVTGFTFDYGLDGVPFNLRKMNREEFEEQLQEEAKDLLSEMGLNISLDEINLSILNDKYKAKVQVLLNRFKNL